MSEIITLGPVGLNPKGEYNSETLYEKLDMVLYNNVSYVAKQTISNVLPTNTTYWDALGVSGTDMSNYYTKTETDDLISAISTMDLKVVESLPTQDISTTTIYLVPTASAQTNNAYDEYIYVSNNWEFIGTTQADLTDYVKNTDYATGQKYGVIKVGSYGFTAVSGVLSGMSVSYNEYLNKSDAYAIAKGTLENVIAGKCINKSYRCYR